MNADALIGAVLDTYTLQKMIGRGGIGTVFQARQLHSEHLVAVKVLLPMLSLPPDQSIVFLGRFQYEIDAVILLKHPNILPVYEYGEFYGLAYLAMPYIRDSTLYDEMIREGALPLKKAAFYLEQIATACMFAHEHGVIHGNIKPSNIFVQHDGHLLLTDFGVMKLICEGTNTGLRLIKSRMLIGAFDYIAPEQKFGSNKVGESADIYSLGVILYQMITGILPFQSQTIIHQQGEASRAPHLSHPELPLPIEQVLLKALSTYPADRYPSVRHFVDAFRQALTQLGISITNFDSSSTITSADTSFTTSSDSFNVITQTSLLAANQQDKGNLDSSSFTDTPALKSDSKSHKSGIVNKTRFTIPSMSGFLPPSLAQSASISDTSPAASAHKEGFPTSSQSTTSRQVSMPELITEEPNVSLPQLPTATEVQPVVHPFIGPTAPSSIMTVTLPTSPLKPMKTRKRYRYLFLACIILFAILVSGVFAYTLVGTGKSGGSVAPTKGNTHTLPTAGNTGGSVQGGSNSNNTGAGGVQGTSTSNNAAAGSKSFQVGNNSLLVIKGHHSNVNVQNGNAGTIVATMTQHGNSQPLDANDTRILYGQMYNGQGQDQISIATEPGLDVDYNLTVPNTTKIQVQVDNGSVAVTGVSGVTIDTGGGNLDVEDIRGPVDISTVSGDITARSIIGRATMKSVNGSIRVTGVTGMLNAITSNGDVTAREASLSGTSALVTNNGSIDFEGAIDPQGAYKMKTNSGNVNLILPNNAAFQLKASTFSGTVHNDFAGNIVGNAPRAQITINIGSGSVTVNKAV